MTEKKLKIDLSPLWNDNSEKFTIRFMDINEKEKRILAQRIKDIARQARIRNTRGPNTQIIYETLLELNPIIFGEYHQRNAYRQVQGYRTFNINCTRAMNGYWFHQLCQAIYMIDCLKRNLTKKEISDIAYLTCQDWDRVQQFINENIRDQEAEEVERRAILGDIGMEDIAEARRRANENGADRIPDGVFEEEPQEIEEPTQNLGRGILNEVIERGLEGIRSVTEEVFQRRNPEIDRMQVEIRRLERMENTNPIGSYDWQRTENERRDRIMDLRHSQDSLRRHEEREDRPTNQHDAYRQALREGQIPERHTWAVDRGGAEDIRVDIRVPTENIPREYHADFATRRIGDLRPGLIVDEIQHDDEDQNFN